MFFYKLHLERVDWKLNRVRRYVYRIDIINPRKYKKKFLSSFLSLRLVKLFFLTLKYRQFRKMAKVAAEKDGLFEANYCLLLEGRMPSFVYRTNFMYNMFEILYFVKSGNILVNNVLMNYVNLVINVGSFVTFLYRKKARKLFRTNFFKRFNTHTVLFNTPRYLFVNYKLFYAFMERAPKAKDLVYPIKLDIYRATAYY